MGMVKPPGQIAHQIKQMSNSCWLTATFFAACLGGCYSGRSMEGVEPAGIQPWEMWHWELPALVMQAVRNLPLPDASLVCALTSGHQHH